MRRNRRSNLEGYRQVNSRLPASLIKRIDHASIDLECSRDQVVENVLDRYLEDYRREKMEAMDDRTNRQN